MTEIRWKQQFNNYISAFNNLEKTEGNVSLMLEMHDEYESGIRTEDLLPSLNQAVIKAFESTYEMCWKVLKRYMKHHKIEIKIHDKKSERASYKDIFKQACESKLIDDENLWLAMVGARNDTSHSYDSKVAAKIYQDITDIFLPALEAMKDEFNTRYEEEEG